MTTPTFILGKNNWSVKQGNAMAYTPFNNGYVPRPLTFTRASDATVTASDLTLRPACYNLLGYSEQFDNAYWNKSNSSIVQNSIAAPDGSLTADTVIENTANSGHYVSGSVSLSLGTYCASIYVKAKERSKILLFVNGAGKGYGFDVSNGTMSAVTGITSADAYSIQDVGGGWYRCTVTVNTSTPTNFMVFLLSSFSSNTYAGDGVSGIYLWGAQLVTGSQPLNYMATTDRLNLPRVDYSLGTPCMLLEPQRTNGIRNSTMVGAVAGTPGTLPTNWGESLNGLTRQVVGFGYENGIPYIDIKYSGTATGPFIQVNFEASTIITGTQNQAWTNSFYFKIVDATAPPTNYQLQINEFTNVGGYLNGGSITFSPTTTLARYSQVRSNVNATCAYVVPYYFSNITSGQTYNFTVRIAAPQMELGSYATTYIPTTTAAVTRIADTFSLSNIYTNNLITSKGGTWFVELRNNIALTRDNSFNGINLDDAGGFNNGFALRNTGSARLTIQKIVAGAATSLYTTTVDSSKIAIKWNGSSADIFVNGSKVVSATAFTTTQMQNLVTGIQVPVFIKEIRLYDSPLSDSECSEITSI